MKYHGDKWIFREEARIVLIISNILHANRKFRKIKIGKTMLNANTMGNSMMKPGSFIQ